MYLCNTSCLQPGRNMSTDGDCDNRRVRMQSFSHRLQATACTYICGIVLEDLVRPIHSWEWWNTNTWCHGICGKTCQAIWETLAAINSSVDISHRKVMSKPDSSLKWLFSYLRIKVPDASYEFTLCKSYHSKKNMCQRPLLLQLQMLAGLFLVIRWCC